MDFASGLANLEQAAANSQNNRNDRRRGRDYHGGGEDNRRYQPRPRHHHHHDNRGRDNCHRHNNRQQNDRSLDGLARYGYRLPRGPYHRPPPINAKSDRPLHICLLSITIDDLPYEAIWKAWSQSDNPRYKVSLLCHAKFPDRVKSEWLKRRMLLQPRRIVRGNSLSEPEYLSHKPAWGSVEITKAMIDLLVQGMEMGRKGEKTETDPRFKPNRFLIADQEPEDVPPADKFIFISETCVPVTTLEECVNALFVTTKRENKEPRWEPPAKKEEPRWEPPAKKEAPSEQKEPEKKQEKTKEEKEDDKNGEETKDEDKKDEEAKDNDKKEENSKEDTAEEKADDKEEEDKKEQDSEKKEDEAEPAPPVADNPINRTTLQEEEVMYLDISWVNARNFNSPNTPQNKYERDQFNNINRVVPKRYRWKADQWMVLSRVHAAAVLDLDHSSNIPPKDQLWNSFRRINASDEMYFPTTLSVAGILVDNNNQRHNTTTTNDASPWLERRRVTYTDWSMGMRNPASFTKGIKDFATIARLARQQKTLLARKFCPYLEIPGQDATSLQRTGDISVEEWKKELETVIQQEKAGQEQEGDKKEDDNNETKEEEEPVAEEIAAS